MKVLNAALLGVIPYVFIPLILLPPVSLAWWLFLAGGFLLPLLVGLKAVLAPLPEQVDPRG